LYPSRFFLFFFALKGIVHPIFFLWLSFLAVHSLNKSAMKRANADKICASVFEPQFLLHKRSRARSPVDNGSGGSVATGDEGVSSPSRLESSSLPLLPSPSPSLPPPQTVPAPSIAQEASQTPACSVTHTKESAAITCLVSPPPPPPPSSFPRFAATKSATRTLFLT